MEPVTPGVPGYAVNDYMLVLAPHEELRNKILKLKEEFGEKYKTGGLRYTRPHITLVSFTTWAMMEEKIVQRLGVMALGFTPFKVELKDYSSYPTHSIFINVTTKIPVQALVKQVKEFQRLLKMNRETKPHFLDDPHIPIARKLKPWQYDQGWLEFSHRQFTGRFIANHILLLKRKTGEKGAYQILKRFDFQDLPVLTKQGDLF